MSVIRTIRPGASEGTDAVVAVGILETRSVALGIAAADAMLKAAQVELLLSMPTCPGKYLVVVTGQVAAVRAAVEAGVPVASSSLVDDTVIASVHPSVIPALSAMSPVGEVAALGVLEIFSMASAVRAADEAVKSADVRLLEIRLGRGLAGKAYVIITGEVAAVRAATQAALASIEEKALVLATTVIPSPHPGLVDKLM